MKGKGGRPLPQANRRRKKNPLKSHCSYPAALVPQPAFNDYQELTDEQQQLFCGGGRPVSVAATLWPTTVSAVRPLRLLGQRVVTTAQWFFGGTGVTTTEAGTDLWLIR